MRRTRSNLAQIVPVGMALVAMFLATLPFAGCGHSPAPTSASKAESPKAAPSNETLVAIEVAEQPWPQTVRVQGTLIEDEYALLGAKVAGRVKAVLVDLGTPVSQGQPVAELDTEEFDLKVQQAEAQVAQARATLGLKPGVPDDQLDPTKAAPVLQEKALLEEARFNVQRAKSLIGKGVYTQEEIHARDAALSVAEARYASSLNSVQEAIAQLKLRRAELALAVQNREDAVLKAPFVGVIQETYVAPGSYVAVGEAVAALVRADPLRFRAGVPERSALGIATKQPVRIWLEGQTTPVIVQISRISPALDVSNRSLMIEADVANSEGRLRTGMFAEAEIVVDPERRVLAVPASSVVAFGGVEKVWLVAGDKAQPRPIRTGRREGQRVEIVSGLQAGDVILSDGARGHEGVVHVTREQTPPAEEQPDARAALLGQ